MELNNILTEFYNRRISYLSIDYCILIKLEDIEKIIDYNGKYIYNFYVIPFSIIITWNVNLYFHYHDNIYDSTKFIKLSDIILLSFKICNNYIKYFILLDIYYYHLNNKSILLNFMISNDIYYLELNNDIWFNCTNIS